MRRASIYLLPLLLSLCAACTVDQPVDSSNNGDNNGAANNENNGANNENNGANNENNGANNENNGANNGDVACQGDEDCAGGQTCREGTCVGIDAPECAQDDDCPGGQACRGEICVPIEGPVCPPNAAACEGDTVIVRCNTLGTAEERETCPGQSTCVEIDGEPVCQGRLCAPFEIGCLDETTAYACDGEGLEQTPLPCAQGWLCDEGTCYPAPTCQDQCMPGSARCQDGATQSCGTDEDGCGAWETPVDCPQGQRCDSGQCVPSEEPCEDECSRQDAVECASDAATRTCGDFDEDSCLEWSAPAPCGQRQSCQDGACRDSCQDSCPELGDSRCTAQGQVEVCGDFNADGCLEWGQERPCPQGLACQAGACVETCQDQCQVGAARCTPQGQRQTCQEQDGCAVWGSATACGASQICQDGACVEDTPTPCQNTCFVVGSQRCTNNQQATCQDFNNDGCLEWGQVRTCANNQACELDHCAAPCQGPGPCRAGQVIFTEFMVNPSAVTDRNGEYIELHNTTTRPMDLSGCILSDDGGGHEIEQLVIPAGGWSLLVANPNTLENGGLDEDYSYGSDINLRNTSGEDIQLHCGNLLVDEVFFGRTDWNPDLGLFDDDAGVSYQLSSASLTPEGNNNILSWCLSVSSYGDGDLGTPGAPNRPCEGPVYYHDPLENNPLAGPLWRIGSQVPEECNWEWGRVRDEHEYFGPSSCSGYSAQCWGTILDGPYWNQQALATNYVEWGPLSLSMLNPGDEAVLLFDFWYELSTSLFSEDRAQVQISTDGVNFAPLPMLTPEYEEDDFWYGYEQEARWVRAAADLSNWTGQRSIYLRWAMETDSSGVNVGLYIDNVTIARSQR